MEIEWEAGEGGWEVHRGKGKAGILYMYGGDTSGRLIMVRDVGPDDGGEIWLTKVTRARAERIIKAIEGEE